MKAIGKNIIIKPIDEQIKTDFGLVLSGEESDKIRYKKATVINPGSEVSFIKEGDNIYYDKHAGYTMILNGEQLTLIGERDVVIVL
jgi:co-chaperonin GroES (HSP10)